MPNRNLSREELIRKVDQLEEQLTKRNYGFPSLNEDKLKLFIKAAEIAYVGFWEYDSNTDIIEYEGFSDVKECSYETFQISRRELASVMRIGDLEAFDKLLSGEFDESIRNYEYAVKQDGKLRYFFAGMVDIRKENGNTTVRGYIQNVTKLVKKRKKLDLLSKAVNSSRDHIFAVYKDGTIAFVNKTVAEANHTTQDALINTNARGLKMTPINIGWDDFLAGKNGSENETDLLLVRRDEELFYMSSISYLVRDQEGNPVRCFIMADLTIQKQLKSRAEMLNKLMGSILDNIPASVYVKDSGDDFRYLFRNKFSDTYYAPLSCGDVGMSDYEFMDAQLADRYRQEDLEIIKTLQPIRRTREVKNKDGSLRVFDNIKVPVEYEDHPPLILGVNWDITTQFELANALQMAKEKAEESDKLKSAFIANISHEIRTPLNAIVGFARIIAETEDPEEKNYYFSIIEENNNILLNLISDVLDLSKIEAGAMDFVKAPMSLGALCKFVHETFRPSIPKNVKLVLDIPDKEIKIISDEKKLFQVFGNLVSNAVKFTSEGRITMGYSLKEGYIECFVQDTGKGIPEEFIDQVFNRFAKFDSSVQGTGLGLSICRSIVEKVGGTMGAEVVKPHGARMTFTIPYVENKEMDIVLM